MPPSPQPPPPAILGGYQGAPMAAERHNLSSTLQVSARVSSQLDMPETPHLRGVQEAS